MGGKYIHTHMYYLYLFIFSNNLKLFDTHAEGVWAFQSDLLTSFSWLFLFHTQMEQVFALLFLKLESFGAVM